MQLDLSASVPNWLPGANQTPGSWVASGGSRRGEESCSTLAPRKWRTVAETWTQSAERGAQIDWQAMAAKARENVWAVLATLLGVSWAEPDKTRLRETWARTFSNSKRRTSGGWAYLCTKRTGDKSLRFDWFGRTVTFPPHGILLSNPRTHPLPVLRHNTLAEWHKAHLFLVS